MKRISRFLICTTFLGVAQSAAASVTLWMVNPEFGSITGTFPIVGISPVVETNTIINFDELAVGTDVFDQYAQQGVKFRDELTSFSEASTDTDKSPGEISDEAFSSPSNSLEAEDEMFILFEMAVSQVEGYIRIEDGDIGPITLTAYGVDNTVLGLMSVSPGGMFSFQNQGDAAIAALEFSADNDEFFLDELAFSATPIPLPAALWLLGSGILGLVGVASRKSSALNC